jgi:hypothetical protein
MDGVRDDMVAVTEGLAPGAAVAMVAMTETPETGSTTSIVSTASARTMIPQETDLFIRERGAVIDISVMGFIHCS